MGKDRTQSPTVTFLFFFFTFTQCNLIIRNIFYYITLHYITIISTFYSGNSSVGNIDTLHQQIMTAITSKFLISKHMTKKTVLTSYTFFTANTFKRINSFAYINSIVIHHFYDLIFICLKKIVIKRIYHLVVYNFISIIV